MNRLQRQLIQPLLVFGIAIAGFFSVFMVLPVIAGEGCFSGNFSPVSPEDTIVTVPEVGLQLKIPSNYVAIKNITAREITLNIYHLANYNRLKCCWANPYRGCIVDLDSISIEIEPALGKSLEDIATRYNQDVRAQHKFQSINFQGRPAIRLVHSSRSGRREIIVFLSRDRKFLISVSALDQETLYQRILNSITELPSGQ